MLATANRVGILKGNSASTPSEDGVSGIEQHASYSLSDLSNMCPFADICDYQGREPPKKGLDSCCLPCSCDSTCGQIGNCCDKQDNIGHMCHYPIVQQWDPNKLRDINMYFMVDKCLDGSKRDCTEMDAAPWGSLYPVYDLVSQMSFYNPECAQCNGVKEFTEWELTLLYNGEQVNNEKIRRALRGEGIEESTVNFIPPRTMNILRNICSDKLIDRCNVTGSWTNYDAELEESCLRWTSPVLTGARQNLLYANVFCMLCNTRIHYEPDETCLAFETGRDTSLQVAQTFTIDFRRVAALVDQDADKKTKSTTNGGCDRGMVKHVSEVCGIQSFFFIVFASDENVHFRSSSILFL